MKLSIIVLCALLLWHAPPRAFAEEDADAWDDNEEEEVDMDDDQNKFQRPENEHMKGDMGETMFAAIYMSQEAISNSAEMDALREFLMYDRLNYDNLMVADTASEEPHMMFFKQKEVETGFTVYLANKNGRIDDEQLAKMGHVNLPDEAKVAAILKESPPTMLTGMTVEEIRGELADHNVRRKESDADEADEDEDDEEGEVGADGEKKRRRPRKKKFGGWKKRRADRLKKKKLDDKKRRQGFKPFIRMGQNVGLNLPMPVLMAISVGGFGGLIWLVLSLKRTLDSKTQKEVKRREKQDRKAKQRSKKKM